MELVATIDARVRDVLEAADVLSEGGVVEEPAGRVYHGTTSVKLSASRLGVAPHLLAAIAELDPHLRTRTLRLARREAASRAGAGTVGTVRAEITVERRGDDVVVVVDLSTLIRAGNVGGVSR